MRNLWLLPVAFVVLLLSACDDTPDAPAFISIDPVFGPEKTLVVLKGENLADIRELTFNDEPIIFNTAYNSDVALLFRVPVGTPLGAKRLGVHTDGGSFEVEFRVTQDPPVIAEFTPRTADIGDTIALLGENFYPPLEVFFPTETDSALAQITYESIDSVRVIVPPNTVEGMIHMYANGGDTLSPVNFFLLKRELVTDFDGNGLRPDNSTLFFRGFTDQQNDPASAIRRSLPAPVSENFLQLSGTDNLGTIWLGGAETDNSQGVEIFGITTDPDKTFLEMDVNNNGREDSYLLLVLREQGGSFSDFTASVKIDDPGWNKISIPLVRFRDVNNLVIDPTKVFQIKFHLEDRDETGGRIEVNIDNVEFVERS